MFVLCHLKLNMRSTTAPAHMSTGYVTTFSIGAQEHATLEHPPTRTAKLKTTDISEHVASEMLFNTVTRTFCAQHKRCLNGICQGACSRVADFVGIQGQVCQGAVCLVIVKIKHGHMLHLTVPEQSHGPITCDGRSVAVVTVC